MLPAQYVLEHLGVAVSAVTGVLAARGKRVDLFGVIVLAIVTAFGGGTIRDCTIGDTPVFWVKDPRFAYTAAAAALLTFYTARSHVFPSAVLMVADAGALALFTIVGLVKALSFHVPPAIAIAMGVITGVVGGIMRDILLGEIPFVFRPEIYLYATAAFAGAALYSGLLAVWPGEPRNSAIAILAILLLRLAGIHWRITLPVFRPRDAKAPPGPDDSHSDKTK